MEMSKSVIPKALLCKRNHTRERPENSRSLDAPVLPLLRQNRTIPELLFGNWNYVSCELTKLSPAIAV